jgi:hypothetical protein
MTALFTSGASHHPRIGGEQREGANKAAALSNRIGGSLASGKAKIRVSGGWARAGNATDDVTSQRKCQKSDLDVSTHVRHAWFTRPTL